MAKKNRRHLSPEKKAELLRQHLAEKRPIADICDENDLQPSVFYTWMRQLLANAPAALANGRQRRHDDAKEQELKAKIEKLEAKLAKKDSVIAEVTEELVKAKKEAGEP